MTGFSRRRSRPATALVALALFSSCSGDRSRPVADGGSAQSGDVARQDEWFIDRAEDSGLDIVHFNGASGHFYYPEILPPGVGLLDYDNDGDLDVYVVDRKSTRLNSSHRL